MPRSRTRHKHHHHHPNQRQQHTAHAQQAAVHKPKRRSAVSIMVAFIALLGIVIAFISAGTNLAWLATGAIAGGITGYFIGKSMDDLAARNSK